jgi:hypothetical protein
MNQTDQKDMFEFWEELPTNVIKILEQYQYGESYEDCQNLVNALNKIGWTCEYGLSAEPFNLRKL